MTMDQLIASDLHDAAVAAASDHAVALADAAVQPPTPGELAAAFAGEGV